MTRNSNKSCEPVFWVEHMEEGDVVEKWASLEYRHMESFGGRLVIARHPDAQSQSSVPSQETNLQTSFELLHKIFNNEDEDDGEEAQGAKRCSQLPDLQDDADRSPVSTSASDADSVQRSNGRTLLLRESLLELLHEPNEVQHADSNNPSRTSPLTGKRICLLDMKAEKALSVDDEFDVVIAGGILGNVHALEDDEFAETSDKLMKEENYRYTSDDRTAEIRDVLPPWIERRHLGAWQMTTDTAILVAKLVLGGVTNPLKTLLGASTTTSTSLANCCTNNRLSLQGIPYIDGPEIDLNDEAATLCWQETLSTTRIPRESDGNTEVEKDQHLSQVVVGPAREGVEMEGFRYVAAQNFRGDKVPIIPEGMRDYWKESCDDDILW
ncbi:unnamed protein product [Amoebophrya sp. A25]|nr:unnamed protein product [Amoebophrya sp. A25]|eukprot:GSA25T00001938001.1